MDEHTALDAVYTERNLAVQLAARLADRLGYAVGVREGEDPAWPLLYIELPRNGQLSWHIPRAGLADFAPYDRDWDGHTTSEKLARLRAFLEGVDCSVERAAAEVPAPAQGSEDAYPEEGAPLRYTLHRHVAPAGTHYDLRLEYRRGERHAAHAWLLADPAGGTARAKTTALSPAWLEAEGELKLPDPDEGEDALGTLEVVERGALAWGAQRPDYREFFLDGARLVLRTEGRQAARVDGGAAITEYAEGIQGDVKVAGDWLLERPRDARPYVLSDQAVADGWLPPRGVSALPPDWRARAAADQRYWELEGEAAQAARQALAAVETDDAPPDAKGEEATMAQDETPTTKALSLDARLRRIRDAFLQAFAGTAPNAVSFDGPWVQEIFADHLIAEYDDALWRVPYDVVGEEEDIDFAPRAAWQRVEVAYVERAAAAGVVPRLRALWDGLCAQIETHLRKEAWDTAYVNDLPDAAFLYVEEGEQEDGKTTPRTKRHLPYRDAAGEVDLPHLRNAISRLAQEGTGEGWLSADLRARLLAKARRLLAAATDKAAETAPPRGALVTHKQADGRYRWALISSTAFQDQDGDIVTRQALEGVCALWPQGDLGPLRFWHVPGLDFGDCDHRFYDGVTLIETGLWREDAASVALREYSAAHPEEFGVSIAQSQVLSTR